MGWDDHKTLPVAQHCATAEAVCGLDRGWNKNGTE